MPAQTQLILFAHTQSDIETNGRRTVCLSGCLSVPPPSAVDFSAGSNESEKNHCCNGDDGKEEARVSQSGSAKCNIISRADRKSHVRQCLGFCSADS